MSYLRSLLPFGSLPAALLWLGCSAGDPVEPEDSAAGATAGRGTAGESDGGTGAGAGDGAGAAGGVGTGGKGGEGGSASGNDDGGEGNGTAGDGGDAGSGTGGSSAGGSSGEAGNGGAGGALGGQACTDITNDAPVASFTRSASAAVSPAPSGGAILAGTYRASSVTYYGAPSSCADADDVHSTLVITPSGTGTGTWERVTESNGVELRERKRYTVNGSQVRLLLECASPVAGALNIVNYRFTASATELRVFDDAPPCGSTVGMVYTKLGAEPAEPSACDEEALGPVCAMSDGCASPTYTVNGDGTVTSSCCGLEWQQTVALTEATWTNAASYCAGLALAGGGWRLPTLEELYSLVAPGQPASVDPVAFPSTQSDYFWTSSPWSGGATSACTIYFGSAATAGPWPVTSSYRVRCVR